MSKVNVLGLSEEAYNAVAAILGSDVGTYFDTTPYVDENNMKFYLFKGDQDDWLDFLLDNDLDEDAYGIGSFTMYTSRQGSGHVE